MPSKLAPIHLTQEAAATQLGVDATVLRRGLIDLDVDAKGKKTLPLRTWVKCITGDGKAERIRLTREHANLMAINRLRVAGEVADMADVKRFFGAVLTSFRGAVLEAPSALSYQLNPADPVHAELILREWAVRTLDSVSKQVESYKPTNADGPSTSKTTKRVAPRTRGVVGRASATATPRSAK